MMGTTLATSAFGFVFWLVAARLLTASAVGVTAAITSTGSIVELAASLGVGGTLIQTLPGRVKPIEWSTTFWAGVATAGLLSVGLCAIAVLLLPLLSPQLTVLRSVRYAVVFAPGVLALATGATLDYVFISERRASDMFRRNAVAAATKVLVLAPIILFAGAEALSLLEAWGTASIFGVGLGAVLLVRRVNIAAPPSFQTLARAALGLRSRLAGHQVIGMGAVLLPYLLPLLVTARLSARDNAYFYTAWMLAGIFFVIAGALSQSVFAEGAHRSDELRAIGRAAVRITAAILIPGLIVVLVLGRTMLSAFGPAYAHHAVGLLRLAVLASIPDAVTNLYVAILRVQGRLTAAALLNLAMGLGTLVMAWFLLPVVGISAVGWAVLTMQLCGSAYVVTDLRRQPRQT
jgi:O-antigen/teichoic acid export membrane protein